MSDYVRKLENGIMDKDEQIARLERENKRLENIYISAVTRARTFRQMYREQKLEKERLEKALEIACTELAEHQCPNEFDMAKWPECEDCSQGNELHYNVQKGIDCWKRWALEKAGEGVGVKDGS